MNSQDKKEIVEMMGGVLEDIVLPRFQGIEDDIVDIKTDIKDIKETQKYHSDRLESINGRLNAEINRKDDLSVILENHEKRLAKVEAKVA